MTANNKNTMLSSSFYNVFADSSTTSASMNGLFIFDFNFYIT